MTLLTPILLLAALAGATDAPAHVRTISGLDAPVAVLHDAAGDVELVANISGGGAAHDGNGFISRLSPAGDVLERRFIAGGANGVTLDAPKGMAILGDALFVADIDVVRVFDRRSGRPLRTVMMPAPGALFLNEMTTGPDDAVYVTDTRLEFHGDDARHLGPDRVFRISRDGQASLALEADLEAPSGIAWDAAHARFLIAALQGKHVYAWRPGERAPRVVWTGIGGYDGIAIDGATWLVSTLDGRGIYEIRAEGPDRGERRIVDGLQTPAAIGFDAKRRHLWVPSFDGNWVQIFAIPAPAPRPPDA